ncbi:nuclear transport factor 2 family protein [Streptomyces olivaceus]|uniref:nuclear transport factor 2 family protein n=1 Tax=Streptomyces olivaceus TaxID=47716 RepID=UPI00365BC42F
MSKNPALTGQDEAEIARLLADYAFSLDRRDWPRVVSLFTEDVSLQIAFDNYLPEAADFQGTSSGSKAVVEGLSQQFKKYDGTQHLLGASQFEVTDGGVHAVTQFVAHHHRGSDYYHTGGTYDDHLVRTPEGWKIARRALLIHWTTGSPDVALAP